MSLTREEYLAAVEVLAARSVLPGASPTGLRLFASARLCAAAVEHTAKRVTRAGSGQRFLAKLALRPSRALLPERPWEKAIMLATAALDADPALLPSLVEDDELEVDLVVVALQHQVAAGSLEVLERATAASPSVVFGELLAAL